LVLLVALGPVVPGHAACAPTVSGSVKLPWPAPDIVAHLATQGVFGWTVTACGWAGKSFEIDYVGKYDTIPQGEADIYKIDLDVYFRFADNTWTQETYAQPGPDSGSIPGGATEAYVMISWQSPAAEVFSNTYSSPPPPHDVQFTFTVS
jgi:hypothetical protein